MFTRLFSHLIAGIPCLLASASAAAHFQLLIPSTDSLDQHTGRTIQLELAFTHPMAGGPFMDMGQPVHFGVLVHGQSVDLLDTLQPERRDGKRGYRATFKVKRPGDHLFHLDPAPYWEPAEGKWIIQYTKVIVDAYGGGNGWDASSGQPLEIEPLTRPYGLWSGNLFRGVVKYHGKPLPYAVVEAEWLNDGSVTPPNDAFITQVIKTDANGQFAYAMPRAGWWGFAALLDADYTLPGPDGRDAPVELGGVMWVYTRDMK
jgi:cobalt/nickel transport protein